MRFEWDPLKAAKNLKRHGVSFPEATTVFGDPFELTIPDPDHSLDEQRFLSVGMSAGNRLLLVSYTERGSIIRIIHARTAASKERRAYDSGKTTEG
jgi:uncharacterized DUF497 family protein